VGENNGHNYFNVWTSFNSNSRRKKNMAGPDPEFAVENYRIDATVDPQLLVRATTRMEVTPKRKTRAAAFIISSKMRVLDANVDGQPAEVFERESARSNLIRADDDQEFLVVAASELEAGKPHHFEVRHEGAVISTAGDHVYYVASRATWYPRRGSEFARYDLTFHYPKDLGFVATGDFVEERIDGDWKITRRKTDVPIRFAAFNLGNYKSVSITQGPYKIDVYANRALESALKPKPEPPDPPASEGLRRRPPAPMEGLGAAPPNPVGRLEALATDVASAFGFMVSEFGPPPLRTLTVSPIPGGFGQGFPSLLYLSTLAYLDPAQRPKRMRDRFQETFFNDMLDAHEIAHQWWGNLVQGAGYQDAWLMEALANYSALMYLEKKKGPHAVDTILDDLRGHLVERSHTGRPLESAGPITWGYRLSSSQSPDAWHHIIYDKGAWVMHMLRRRMGDDRFLAMLRAMCKRYEYQSISTEQFRQLTAEFMPPNSPDSDLTNFFDTWIYGTGIPAIKMTAVVHGLKVSGTLTQSDVPDDFSTRVPVEVQAGRQHSLFWVMTASDPVQFDMTAKALPVKVTLDGKDALIVVKK
jgi:aminopeptidase N